MRLRLVFVLLVLFALGRAVAADSGTDRSVVVDRHVQRFTVEADGSYVLQVELVKTICSATAIEQQAEQFFSFNASLDTVGAIEAWTTKADGRRMPVGPAGIREQQEAASSDAPMFQDTRLKAIIFPDVAVGDTLTLRYTVRRHTPLFPGHFEDFTVARPVHYGDFRLIYDLPASMTLQDDAAGFAALALDSAPGRRRYGWRHAGGDNPRIEHGAVSYLDYGKRLAVSTFPDYAAFAHAYQKRAAAAATPDDALIRLAADITRGIDDPHARALAL